MPALNMLLKTEGFADSVGNRICRRLLGFLCLLILGGLAPALTLAQDQAKPPAQGQTSDTSEAPTTPQGNAPAAAPTPAQDAAAPAEAPSDDEALTLFPHSQTARYWISGQANVVFQWHPTFYAKFTGPNSMTPEAQSATTHVLTLYLGYQLTHTTDVLLDIEDSTGSGIANALGLGGLTDLDAVRISQGVPLSKRPYLARFMLHQIIPLSKKTAEAERGPLSLETSLPVRRIEFRLGKMTLADFFDTNSGGTDSHLQFLNWTVDNNGAWDYAANTRGYTDAAVLEYDDHAWSVRFAEALMPKIANGIHLDADIARARAENFEVDYQKGFLPGRSGAIRFLSYLNTANMGKYRDAIDEFLDGETPTPDIIATRRQGRHKYGFGLNWEQDLTSKFGIFGRLGWSDGRNESYVYTEVDRSGEFGTYIKGEWWKRRYDRAGVAFTVNGLSGDHARYLALGGVGFLLGDGALSYGDEKIVEAYYTAHVWRGLFASFDLQHINDPGYNEVRGPVLVPTLRAHVDF